MLVWKLFGYPISRELILKVKTSHTQKDFTKRRRDSDLLIDKSTLVLTTEVIFQMLLTFVSCHAVMWEVYKSGDCSNGCFSFDQLPPDDIAPNASVGDE